MKPNFTDDQLDDLKEIIRHPGFNHVLAMVDGIVENIQGNVLSVSLDKDPEQAKTQLLMARMKFEGALALRAALSVQIRAIKESKR